MAAERRDFIRDLVGELTGRAEHEGLTGLQLGVESGHHGDREGAGLPTSRVGLDDHVDALLHEGDDSRLNRHGQVPTELANAAQDFVGNIPEGLGFVAHG